MHDKDNTPHKCQDNSEDDFGILSEKLWLNEHNQAPENLFHYCTVENAKAIIDGKKMWASAFECMNDEQEFRKGMNIAQAEISKAVDLLPTDLKVEMKKSWQDLLRSETESPKLRPYILSFSATDDNRHLWKEYTQDHQGLAIQIVNKKCTPSLPNGCFIKVNYDETTAREKLRQQLADFTKILIQNSCNKCIRIQSINLSHAFLQAFFRMSITLKNAKWSPEQEWRLVVFGCSARTPQSSHGAIKFRTKGPQLIDYLEVDIHQCDLKFSGLKKGDRFPENSLNSIKLFAQKYSLKIT